MQLEASSCRAPSTEGFQELTVWDQLYCSYLTLASSETYLHLLKLIPT